MTTIIPAILTDSIEQARQLFAKYAGLVDWLQIDIMDGAFVSGKSIAVAELLAIEHHFKLDFHLMVEHPETYIADCVAAGAKRIIFQLEACPAPAPLLADITSRGVEAGVALRPETPVERLEPYREQLDVVLLLCVNPGKQGQSFLPDSLQRIRAVRQLAPRARIEVDGGINAGNIKAVVDAGADFVVVGSALAQSVDPAGTLSDLQRHFT